MSKSYRYGAFFFLKVRTEINVASDQDEASHEPNFVLLQHDG